MSGTAAAMRKWEVKDAVERAGMATARAVWTVTTPPEGGRPAGGLVMFVPSLISPVRFISSRACSGATDLARGYANKVADRASGII
ncbi:hypothetical protein E2562_029783 [Oryza meyeriana var. granulata]|uniref:Uncharacterized protein n=1 Tax=Oryza meyeriana var. granulata TaxID=110450 RepID=A0A6G1E4A5_9ORYZ|nr:hypothetical protein E2562_029783 [Oryza meyeriana var. granulata]